MGYWRGDPDAVARGFDAHAGFGVDTPALP